MKKVAVVFLGMVFVLSIFIGVSLAAEKFAYVDLSRIFAEYGKTKEYDKLLSDKENLYTSERNKKVTDLKAFQDKLNLLSDKEKDAKKSDLDAKVKGFQDYDRQKQTDLRKEQDEKMKEILKDIEETVKAYGEKEGYTMIFNDKVLVYQSKALDITDKIISLLNSPKK